MKKFGFNLFNAILIGLVVFIILPGCNKEKIKATNGETTIKNTLYSSQQKTASSAKKSTTTTTGTATTSASDQPSDLNQENLENQPLPENTPGSAVQDEKNKYSWDFKGKTIVIGRIGGVTKVPTQFPVTDDFLSAYVYGSGNSVLDKEYEFAREIEQQFNCKIMQVSIDQKMADAHSRFTGSVMAGLNEWDIMLTQSLFITPTFMLSNLILPVSDYIEFEDDPVLNDGFVKNIVTYKGKQWGIPFAMSLPGFPVSLPNNNFGFIYNEDILNTEGLPDLLELDLQGRWNWDKLVEIGSSATHDYNGDGIVDQWGMALFGPNPVIHIVAANKGTIISYENGRYEFAINDSASLRALTFISDLFNTYKIATIDGKAFKNGKALMDPFYIGRGQITPYVTAGMDTSKIKMVRYPMGPDNPDGKPTLTVNVSVSLIPATSIDPEGIAKFMAVFFQTYNHPDLIVNPDEALAGDIDFIFGDAPGLLDYWIRMRRLVDNDVINYGAWGTPFTGVGTLLQGQLLTNISNPGISIKNYIESIRTSLQNDIDTVAIQ